VERAAYLRRALNQASFLAAPLAVLAVAVWVISPRFSIKGPSFIDDWNALLSAPSDMHAIVHLNYDVTQRFRPTWILWNWLQWRAPGAPGDMLGPNLFGVARVALLIGGLTALAAIVVPRGNRNRFEQAVLCVSSALVVVTVPAFGEDLARFGPEEPALVGGMMLGGSLLYWGGRELAKPVPSQVRAWSYVVFGFLAWCYGVLHKETSVCILLVLALAIPLGRGLVRRMTHREIAIGASLIGLALIPVLGMLYEVLRIVQRGTLVYGVHVKAGSGSISVFVHALQVMRSSTHSVAGFVLLGVIGAAIAFDARSRRVDWIQLTILVVALAALEMNVQTNFYEPRYYLPTLALLAVGAARAVGRLPVLQIRAVIVAVCVLALVSAAYGRSTVRHWATGERVGDQLVATVRAQTQRGCRLTLSGIDDERSYAITTLVGYPHSNLSCAGVPRYLLLGPSAERSAEAVCSPARPVVLDNWNVANTEQVQFVRCGPS
jgi:hypothetical protein